MDILDIFLDILLKPPQPLMGLFSIFSEQNYFENDTAVIYVTFIERFVHFFRLRFQEPMSLFLTVSWHA